jgi:hypothetical protein
LSLRQALGWTEGSNLRIELRWGAADPDRTKALAKELVDAGVRSGGPYRLPSAATSHPSLTLSAR